MREANDNPLPENLVMNAIHEARTTLKDEAPPYEGEISQLQTDQGVHNYLRHVLGEEAGDQTYAVLIDEQKAQASRKDEALALT